MIDDILNELKSDISKSHEVLKKGLTRIRTGRANPDVLDVVRVDYWGTPTPISQMATISVPEARMLRLPMPMLTEERRKDLTKVARKTGEEGKVSIRKHRQDARALLESLKDDGEVGEDDVERALKKVDEIVQAGTATVDEIVARKEKDILEL
jgi:ribosome recycling factor